MSARMQRLRDLYLARARIDAEIHRLAPQPRTRVGPLAPDPWVAEVLADAQRVLAELMEAKAQRDDGVDTEPARIGFDVDEWVYLVEAGVEPEQAAMRCGVTLEAVYTRARRNGRDDVLDLLEQRRKAA